MEIDDPAVPTVGHLTGPGAAEVLAAAVTAAGGALHDVRVSQVQYRPGCDVVVRYRADVTWADGRRRPGETLLAAAGADGPLPGTVPVEATAGAETLVASVWRYPFDPVVPGLERAVTPDASDQLLADAGCGPSQLEVVAYRPTERAVVRATGTDGRVVYLKAVPPSETVGLVARHVRLRGAGLPVPEVVAADEANGLVALAELPGTTLRERIKGDLAHWPDPPAVAALLEQIHTLDGFGPSARSSRTADAVGHGRLLEVVLPEAAPVLRDLTVRFAEAADAVQSRSGEVVHGDLHEGQLVVDDRGRITGLLDIDDLGTGDPLDDAATLLGHLRFRALLLVDRSLQRRLLDHTRVLEASIATAVDPAALDLTVAAVLVGLATGPFRIQRARWRTEALAALDAAVDTVDALSAT